MKTIMHLAILMFTCGALFGAVTDDSPEPTGPASLFDLSLKAVLRSPKLTAQLESLDRTASAELIYEAMLKRGPLGPRFILQAPDTSTGTTSLLFDGTTAYAYSHDGTKIAATAARGQLNVWDTRNGQLIKSLNTDKDTRSLAFSLNDNSITTITSAGRASTLSLQTDEHVVLPRGPGRPLVTALSPNALMDAQLEDDHIQILDVASNEIISKLADPKSVIHRYKTKEEQRLIGAYPAIRSEYTVLMRFSPDNSKIAVAGQTQTGGGIWDTQTGTIIRPLPSSRPWPSSALNPLSPGLAFSGNSKLLALLPPQELVGKNIALVTTDDNSKPHIIKLPKGIAQIKALALNSDGSLLAGHFTPEGPRAQGFIALLDTRTQEFVQYPFAIYDYCDWLMFSPDNTQLAAASRSSRGIALWDINVPTRITTLTSDELSFLMEARQAWDNDESYQVDAGNPIYQSVITKLPNMKSPLLFTAYGTTAGQASSSTDAAYVLSDDLSQPMSDD